MPNDSAASQQELVSVICRSTGRPTLQQALDSLASQSYAAIEVILVNAAGADLQAVVANQPDLTIRIVGDSTPLARSQAANTGMEAATGNWFLFLDDDDWIAPEHIAGLLQALAGQDQIRAAYSSTQKTNAEGQPTDYQFQQGFDPVLLCRDNYIPIHAMLFNRSLFESGCRFDTRFDIYEDWDFWLQLRQHTDFIHVDKLTAYYREGGESETAGVDASQRYRHDNAIGKARAMLFDKWMPSWSGQQINAMLGSLDESELLARLTAELEEMHHKLNSEHATNLQHQQQIKSLMSQLEATQHELAVANQKQEQTNLQLAELENHIANLQAEIASLLDSTSWKVTAPIRSLGRMLKPGPHRSDKSDESS